MSKSVDKGTRYENHCRDNLLRTVWPDVERRAKQGINDYGDFINVGLELVEAKWRKKIYGEIWNWIGTVLTKVGWREHHLGVERGTLPWVIVFAQDKRFKPKIDLVITDARRYFDDLARLNELEIRCGVDE